VMRVSFGTTEVQTSGGNPWMFFNFFPEHIVSGLITRQLSPNVFNVLSLVYNTTGVSVFDSIATQTANAPVTILGNHSITGTLLPGGGVASFRWRDSVQFISGCNGGEDTAALSIFMQGRTGQIAQAEEFIGQ